VNAPAGRLAGQAVDGRREALLAWLLDEGVVDANLMARARSVAERTRQPVELSLNQLGAISDALLAEAYARVSGCRVWAPDAEPVDPHLDLGAASADFLRLHRLLPVRQAADRLVVAAVNPLDDQGLAGLAFATGADLEIRVARAGDYRDWAATAADPDVTPQDERRLLADVQAIADSSAESAGARLLASVFEAAVTRGASDIHFEPRRHDLRVRLRVDGQLLDHQDVSADFSPSVVSRIKVLANLDLGERRLPQDGRASFVVAGRRIDVRVATLPSAFGEAATLRLLDRAGMDFSFAGLGFAPERRDLLASMAAAPHGLFLVTGPTGSGKTTTLYGLLDQMADQNRKILSIEDPIEYHFAHVVQTQAAPQIGLTFASALRAFLRQDPDVILVGEIRDEETAQVAIQAALTGHLVLASLHANRALGVIPRLLDMGVEPYQLAAGLRGALAQRLVRKLCPACRAPRAPTLAEQSFLARDGVETQRVFEPVGCPACDLRGFRGRLAVSEGFAIEAALSAAIAAGAPQDTLEALAGLGGDNTMHADGGRKAREGLTSVSEVMALGTP